MKTKRRSFKSFNRNRTQKILSKVDIHKDIIKKATISKPKQGWVQITITGEPFERGYQHGYLLADQFDHIVNVLSFIVKQSFKVGLREYIGTCKKLITPKIAKYYPEFLEEIKGISKGAKVSVDFLIAWNSLMSMYTYYNNLETENGQRCSAFIA